MDNRQEVSELTADRVTADFDGMVRHWPTVRDHEDNLMGYMPTIDQVRLLRSLVRVRFERLTANGADVGAL